MELRLPKATPNAMNMQINRFQSNPLEVPLPNQQRAGQVSGRGGAILTSSPELVPLDSIDALAGVKDGLKFHKKSLMQRRLSSGRSQKTGRGSSSKKREKLSGGAGFFSDSDEDIVEDDASWSPVNDTLNALQEDSRRNSRAQIQATLEESFEPVQRYNVLFDALKRLENALMDEQDKARVKNALNEMMSDLIDRYSHDLRRALQESDEMVNSLEAMANDEFGFKKLPSTRELRFLIGAKSTGKLEAPLTPLTMLKALIRNFGVENCMDAMTSVRARMMSGF